MRTLLQLATILVLGAPAAFAQAACDSWQALGTVGYAGSSILAIEALPDTGQLYVATECYCGWHGIRVPQVDRRVGQGWQTVLDGWTFDFNEGQVNGLAAIDLGAGPRMYVFGQWSAWPPIENLMRVDSTGLAFLPSIPGAPYSLIAFDDGTGPLLHAGSGTGVHRFDGTTWLSMGATAPSNRVVYQLTVHDDGSGPALYACGSFTSLGGVPANGIARWNGSTWEALAGGLTSAPPPLTNSFVSAMCSTRDASGPALYVGGAFTLADGQVTNGFARWSGTSWSPVGSGLPSAVQYVYGLDWFDEGTGLGPMLVASGFFVSNGGPLLHRWNGASWSPLPAPTGGATPGYGPLLVTNLPDTPRRDLVAVLNAPSGQSLYPQPARIEACEQTGRLFCLGNGFEAPCPCGNESDSGEYAGCRNSLGIGGALRAEGEARITADTLLLHGSGMPNNSALYFQAGNQHAPFAFGDGLKCTNGPFVRMRTLMNTGGASTYPGPGDPAISQRAGVVAPGMRHYQVRYRNSADFCTPDTFNYTNGVTILWTL